MVAGMYGFLGAIVAMVGVSVGLLVKLNTRLERIEELLESRATDKK